MDHRRKKSGPSKRAGIGIIVVALIGSVIVAEWPSTVDAATSANATVDFTNVVAQVPASNIGFTATTFGVDGGPVPDSSADQTALKSLDAGAVRIHLAPNSAGQIVSGAQGGATNITGDQWLTAYEAMGLEPTVIVNLNKADALAVLNYVNATHHHVTRYILGNEMDANSDSNVSAATYISEFKDIASAMRAITPGLQIGGPAPAYFGGATPQLVDGIVDVPAAQKASFIDYHAYGAGDGQSATTDTSMQYSTQIAQLRQTINDPSVGIEVGEYNMNWGNDPRNNSPYQTMWVANALGSILSQGAIAFQYGDMNDAMGLVNSGAPKASYWGLGMFTGGDQFRHFGTAMVGTTSANSNVHLYASVNSRNIVVVNSGAATTLDAALTGYSAGTASEWQSTAITPVHKPDVQISGGMLSASLPATSVTTFVLADPAAGGSAASAAAALVSGAGSAATTVPAPATSAPSSTSAAPAAQAQALATTAPTKPVITGPVPSSQHGLTATYYNGMRFTGSTVRTVDPTINFNWGSGSPRAGIAPKTYSVRWSGQIQVDAAGTYTFQLVSDDGMRLYIDGSIVVNAWSNHPVRSDYGTVALSPGRHDIRVDYYQNRGVARAGVLWSDDDGPFTFIPAVDLYTN